MTLLRLAVLALAALALPASAASRRVTIVAEADEPLRAAVVRSLSKAGRPVRLYTFDAGELADPIRKGELLSRLANSDLVVPIGDAATTLVLGEVEDVPIYFVGAAVFPGKGLEARTVSGILGYDPGLVVDAVARLWPGRLGLAYTPGYEDVAELVRQAARARGLDVVERKIDRAGAIPPALGALLSSCKSVWLLGDPLLSRGAGFEFATERSLTLRVPLIGVDAAQVERGAFLASEPHAERLADAAAAAIGAREAAAPPGARFQGAPDGRIVVNGALSRRWGVKVPQEDSWQTR